MLNKVIVPGEAVGSLATTGPAWTVDFLLLVHRIQVSLHIRLTTESSALPLGGYTVLIGTVLWFSVPLLVVLVKMVYRV